MSKICHITTVHAGRDTRIFYKECKSLARAGHDVTLLTINGESFKEDDVKVLAVPCSFKGRLQRFRKASKTIYRKALEEEADLYHFHDPEFLPFAARMIRKGKKVIYDVHEDLPRQLMTKHYIPGPLRKTTSVIVERKENQYARRMSGIITATSFIRDRFLRIHKEVTDIKNYPVLPEGINKQTCDRNTSEIVYIGSLTRERGISELIRAMEHVDPGIRLNLAGTFSPDNYRKTLTKLNGWKQVNEIGFAGRRKAKELMNKSFAGMVTLHPTVNYLDALPVKMFEYMSAGLPVIASDFPILKEIIEKNDCGLCVDPLNPEAIGNAIKWIMDNPEKGALMGANGRKAVMETYNWGREEQKLIAFYDRFLNS